MISKVFKWVTTYINTRTRGGYCIIKMSGASESTPVPEWCKVGGFIDAKDTVNSWCVARVVELDTERNRILVNYDGWSKNYNNVLNINSSKIAPFRKHSAPYTGQKKHALRDWTFSQQEIQLAVSHLDQLLSGELMCDTAYETTQFIRGHVFILIDCLLNHTFTNEEDLQVAVNLFTSVLRYILAWLRQAPELFPHYYQTQTQPDLYQHENRAALAYCWPELIMTLRRLFAIDGRCSFFFTQYDSVPKDYESVPSTRMDSTDFSKTLLYLINLFAKEGGFEALLKLVQQQE